MKLKFDLKIIFLEKLCLMGDRKGEKSGAIFPFITESQLCWDSVYNQEAIYASAGIA